MSAEPDWSVLDADVDRIWHEVSRSATGTTFFHTPRWAEILERTFPAWRRAPLAIGFSDGNVALVPCMARRSAIPGAGHRESMLPGVYGGPLFRHAPDASHWRATWDALDRLPDLFLYGNPFLPWVGEPRGASTPETTLVLDLEPGFERVQASFRYTTRSGIRAARARGFSAERAEAQADVDAYDAVYRDSLKRWGRKARGFYPPRLFRELFAAGRDEPAAGSGDRAATRSVELWVVRREGEVVGGAWILTHDRHADYWHACVRSDAMALYPMHLLVATAVEHACAAGLRWFDFNPSGGLAGVELFKRGFSPEVRAFSMVARFRPVCRGYRRYRRVCEKLLGRCPH